MSEMQEQALKKLREEDKAAKFDRYGNAVHKEVREALEEFIRQDEEFAQAVVQGGNFGACIQQVIQGVKGSISDLEAYRRAVRFYFPGANVRFQMVIDLIGEAGEAATTSSTASGPPLALSLTPEAAYPSLGKAKRGEAEVSSEGKARESGAVEDDSTFRIPHSELRDNGIALDLSAFL